MSASHQAAVMLAPGSHSVPTADLDSTTTDSLCGWGGVGGVCGVGGLGGIIKSNLNRVRLSCCWVGVGLGCDN